MQIKNTQPKVADSKVPSLVELTLRQLPIDAYAAELVGGSAETRLNALKALISPTPPSALVVPKPGDSVAAFQREVRKISCARQRDAALRLCLEAYRDEPFDKESAEVAVRELAALEARQAARAVVMDHPSVEAAALLFVERSHTVRFFPQQRPPITIDDCVESMAHGSAIKQHLLAWIEHSETQELADKLWQQISDDQDVVQTKMQRLVHEAQRRAHASAQQGGRPDIRYPTFTMAHFSRF